MLKVLSVSVLCLSFLLTGCATPDHQQHFKSGKVKSNEPLVADSTSHHKAKNPQVVAFYHHPALVKRPYRIVGKESVSRYNLIGLQRQEETMAELMKKVAASMGGDAVINITQDDKKVEGTVISYERVLL